MQGGSMPTPAAGSNQMHALYEDLKKAMCAGQELYDAATSKGCGCLISRNELCPACRGRLLAALDRWEKM
jgi:hypothetical protein